MSCDCLDLFRTYFAQINVVIKCQNPGSISSIEDLYSGEISPIFATGWGGVGGHPLANSNDDFLEIFPKSNTGTYNILHIFSRLVLVIAFAFAFAFAVRIFELDSKCNRNRVIHDRKCAGSFGYINNVEYIWIYNTLPWNGVPLGYLPYENKNVNIVV